MLEPRAEPREAERLAWRPGEGVIGGEVEGPLRAVSRWAVKAGRLMGYLPKDSTDGRPM
jgi:hypothetical protein